MAFGVTLTGFNRKTFEGILAELEADWRADIDPNIDLSDETPPGQMNAIFGAHLAEAWEGIEAAFNAYNPNSAEGAALVNTCLITGTTKRGAAPSTVTCSLNLDAGTLVPAGSLVSLDTRPDIRFELSADVHNTGGITANLNGAFVSVDLGPVQALAGHLTHIDTPIAGWNSSTNPLDAAVGHLADNDVTLRQRRNQQLNLRGGSTLDAVRADLLDSSSTPALVNVTNVEMLENDLDGFDPIKGLPGHSFEALIEDGGLTSNNVLAQVIFDGKPAGIYPFGNTSGTAVDRKGRSHVVRFSRPIERSIYVVMSIRVTSLFPVLDGEDQVKAAIVAHGKATFDIGDDVTALALGFGAFAIVGVLDVPVITIGFIPSPAFSIPLPIGLHERGAFDSSRIVLTVL